MYMYIIVNELCNFMEINLWIKTKLHIYKIPVRNIPMHTFLLHFIDWIEIMDSLATTNITKIYQLAKLSVMHVPLYCHKRCFYTQRAFSSL